MAFTRFYSGQIKPKISRKRHFQVIFSIYFWFELYAKIHEQTKRGSEPFSTCSRPFVFAMIKNFSIYELESNVSRTCVFAFVHPWSKVKEKLFPPGLEPGTFRVLGERDNHYTTETLAKGPQDGYIKCIAYYL